VFSSGVVFGKAADWEKEHKGGLGDAAAREGLKLLWFATGSEDFLMARTRETVGLFKKHGFSPVFRETGGGHTWIDWQRYLKEFAPQLFRQGSLGKAPRQLFAAIVERIARLRLACASG
jgi:hypothetical protein